MTIHFYLDDETETPITSIYDLTSNPFKIGDEIYLTVDGVYPVDYGKFKEEYRTKVINDNKELESKFNRKKIKLVREGKHMSFKVIKECRLTIEYHCVYSPLS
jgi:hypothetical protein